ncbi:MAG TPA: ATP-binding cassette domain-containing protein [Segetibacter sp.]|jgi:putative ABC transport system ATP-binding protein
MNIELQNIVPIPLKDKFSSRSSDIWSKSITFSAGEWIKIVAPSGTGKTTLMNILYKLRHDYEGTINWDSADLKKVTGDNLAQLRQLKASVIFQDLRLFENLTARENIDLNRVLQQPFYEAGKIDEMAEVLGITHILNQRAGVCSYGEQQRTSIIRALVQPFDWLIMDEPFSHLDIANTNKAAALIAEECKKRNAGFILTDLDEDNLFPYTKNYRL